MNINDVREELGDSLSAIQGLNVLPFSADRITPPVAMVDWPEPMTFDATMRRGADTATFPVVVLVGRADTDAAAVELGAYCDGSGPRSVKALIEAHQGTTYHHARVASVEFGITTVAGVGYLSATFRVDVIGNGSNQ